MPAPPALLLIAEDSADDRLLLEKAWKSVANVRLHLVKDGEELMDYLNHQVQLEAERLLPSLILLDLNLPKKNGFEVLKTLKLSPRLQTIPVIVFTTSTELRDINQSYLLGANSYLAKPDTFEELIHLLQVLHLYWFNIAKLPTC